MKDTDREAEIRQIEQDLTNLQRRYASLERSAKRMRRSYYFLLVALAGFVVLGFVTGNLIGLFASAILLTLAILLAWGVHRIYPELRWIDHVGWSPPGFWRHAIKQTEAMAVEDMVAERMERLSRLKGNY